MSARDDDEAWQAIVDNYGERPVLGESGPTHETDVRPTPEPLPVDGNDVAEPEQAVPDDRFVPPPPPPLPRTTPLRTAAWAGVLGAPTLLLVMALLDLTVPGVLPPVLAIAFVGGFVDLVATMGREPRDPWDNGARV